MAKFCGKCGAQLNKQTGLCPICGSAPVNEEKPEASRKVAPVASQRRSKFCGKCGSPTNPQTGFCTVCGAVTRYTPPEDPGKWETPPNTEEHPKEKPRRTALWVVLAATAVLLAAVAAVGVLVRFGVVDIPVVAKLEERLGLAPRAAGADSPDGTADASGDADGTADSPPEEIRREVRMNCYDANDVLQWYHIYTYDENGGLASETSYDAQGNQTGFVEVKEGFHWTYSYDTGEVSDRGATVVREGNTETITYEDGTLEIIIYNADDKPIEEKRYDEWSDSYYTSCVYEYNADGQMIKIIWYHQDGEVCRNMFYEYDAKGHRVKSTIRDACDPLSNGTITYIYNGQGDMTRENDYDSTGALERYFTYQYAVVGTAS